MQRDLGRSWCGRGFAQCRKTCPWTEVKTCVIQSSKYRNTQIKMLIYIFKIEGTHRLSRIQHWFKKNKFVFVCVCFYDVGILLKWTVSWEWVILKREAVMCLKVMTLLSCYVGPWGNGCFCIILCF